MKDREFNEILWNGVPFGFPLADNTIQDDIVYESIDGIQYALVRKNQPPSFKVNGIEVHPRQHSIWVRRKGKIYEIDFEEVKSYDEKLNLTGTELISGVEGEGLKAVFGCRYLVLWASMFFDNLMDNPHLTSGMRKWFKKNKPATWFSLKYDKDMDRKEVLSCFKATDLFSETESMMEVLLSNPPSDPEILLEAFIITARKKVETKTSFNRFLKGHDFPATLLMDALLAGEISKDKKQLIRMKIDKQLF